MAPSYITIGQKVSSLIVKISIEDWLKSVVLNIPRSGGDMPSNFLQLFFLPI